MKLTSYIIAFVLGCFITSAMFAGKISNYDQKKDESNNLIYYLKEKKIDEVMKLLEKNIEFDDAVLENFINETTDYAIKDYAMIINNKNLSHEQRNDLIEIYCLGNSTNVRSLEYKTLSGVFRTIEDAKHATSTINLFENNDKRSKPILENLDKMRNHYKKIKNTELCIKAIEENDDLAVEKILQHELLDIHNILLYAIDTAKITICYVLLRSLLASDKIDINVKEGQHFLSKIISRSSVKDYDANNCDIYKIFQLLLKFGIKIDDTILDQAINLYLEVLKYKDSDTCKTILASIIKDLLFYNAKFENSAMEKITQDASLKFVFGVQIKLKDTIDKGDNSALSKCIYNLNNTFLRNGNPYTTLINNAHLITLSLINNYKEALRICVQKKLITARDIVLILASYKGIPLHTFHHFWPQIMKQEVKNDIEKRAQGINHQNFLKAIKDDTKFCSDLNKFNNYDLNFNYAWM